MPYGNTKAKEWNTFDDYQDSFKYNSIEILCKCVPEDLHDNKSTLVVIIAWCRKHDKEATSYM